MNPYLQGTAVLSCCDADEDEDGDEITIFGADGKVSPGMWAIFAAAVAGLAGAAIYNTVKG